MDKNDLSTETKAMMLQKTANTSEITEKLLHQSFELYNHYTTGGLKDFKNAKDISKLIEYLTFLCFSTLDLNTDMKIYLTTKKDYERTYSLRNLIVHLNEGYKRNHHFVSKERKNSLWNQNVVKICNNHRFTDFAERAEILTGELLSYENEFQTTAFKKIRQLIVHYDGSPIDFYQATYNINSTLLINNISNYLRLTSSIISLINDIKNRLRSPENGKDN